mmetsp:Transcript_8406/g.25223  ORF Transcript_8406/g.25223 Transcript_8406/m.25223 type:complete len:298 (+) Transcript_8406:606-1499(+)
MLLLLQGGRRLGVLPHVRGDHPPAGPRPDDQGKVHPGLGRDGPRERARGNATADLCGRGEGGRGWGRLLLLWCGHRWRGRGRSRRGSGGGGPRTLEHLRRHVLERLKVLLLLAHDGHGLADLDVAGSLRHKNLGQEATVHSLPLDGGLVRLHLRQDLPRVDCVALLLGPRGQAALGHGGRKRRHAEHGVRRQGQRHGRGVVGGGGSLGRRRGDLRLLGRGGPHLGWGVGLELADVLRLLAEHRNDRPDRDFLGPVLQQNPRQVALLHGLPLDGRLVGLHLRQDVSRGDLVALLLLPL